MLAPEFKLAKFGLFLSQQLLYDGPLIGREIAPQQITEMSNVLLSDKPLHVGGSSRTAALGTD
jgi:hypothetical protein